MVGSVVGARCAEPSTIRALRASAARALTIGVLATLLASCGGGGGGSTPPSVELLTPALVRFVVQGTSVALDVAIKPGFTPTGALSATAVDGTGTVGSGVSVAAQPDGPIVLRLTSVPTIAVGRYRGSVDLNLCTDTSCSPQRAVAKVTVPFDLTVQAPGYPWPGDRRTTLQPWPGIADWGTFQGNAAHTGRVPVTVDPNAFTPRWQIDGQPWPTTNGWYAGNLVATAGGRLFVCSNNTLRALQESDASVVWEYDFSSLTFPSANPPAVANGVVYIAAGQQGSAFLFAFNASDGALRFKAPMSAQWERYLPSVAGSSGVYTNSGAFGGLYAFNTSGQSLFVGVLEQTSMWSAAVDTSAVYTYTGSLRLFDPITGVLLKTIDDPTFTNYVYEIHGSPVLGPDSVFVANYANARLNAGDIGNHLLRFRPSAGMVAWSIAGTYSRTPAYDAGVVFAVNEKPVRLEARAESDGSLLWSWVPPQAGDTNFIGEVLLTRNVVFVSTGAAVYGIDRATHATIWSWPESGHLALSSSGVLYIHGNTHLTAINVK